MARHYDAFLVRHWSLDSDRGERIAVLHVQSGDQSLATSLSQAVTWMQAQIASTDTPERAPPDGDTPDNRQSSHARHKSTPSDAEG